jgi:hypothetical protein
MKKSLLLSLFPLLALSLPAAAADREWVPYKKFVETLYLDKFYNAPPEQKDKVRLRVKVEPENKNIKLSDLVLTISHSGAKDIIPIDADGVIDLVPNPTWIKEDAMIYTSLPKGEKLRVMSSLEAKMPDGLQTDCASLMASVKQWNKLIKDYAGMLSFMAPTFVGVDFHFANPAHQTVQVVTHSVTKNLVADAKGDIELKLDDALVAENPKVIMSERPSEIGMTTD